MHDVGELVPVDVGPVLGEAHELGQVDRAEVARLVRQQRLLTARVRRLDLAELRRRVVAVDAVDEDDAGVAGRPRHLDDEVVDLASVELARDLLGSRVDQVVGGAGLHGLHELLGERHRDVEVGEVAVGLALDEVEDVRVVDAQNAHVGAAARAALLDRLGRLVEHAHERDRSARHALRRAHLVAARAQPREAEAGAAAGLVDQRSVPHRPEDRLHGVLDRQHEARRQLLQLAAGVHQGRRVRAGTRAMS